jgi:hypothetical protein
MTSTSIQLAILSVVMAGMTWHARGKDSRADVLLMALCSAGLAVAAAAAAALD